MKGESEKRETHSIGANGLPQSVEEAVAVAGELHIETEFASQEYQPEICELENAEVFGTGEACQSNATG